MAIWKFMQARLKEGGPESEKGNGKRIIVE